MSVVEEIQTFFSSTFGGGSTPSLPEIDYDRVDEDSMRGPRKRISRRALARLHEAGVVQATKKSAADARPVLVPQVDAPAKPSRAEDSRQHAPRTPLEKQILDTAAKGPVVAGFVRIAEYSGVEDDVVLEELEASVQSLALEGIRSNLTSKDHVQEVGKGEYLIVFGYGSPQSAEESVSRMRSEIRSKVAKEHPKIEVVVDRFVQPLEVEASADVVARIYEELRRNAPSLQQRAASEDAANMQRGRTFFKPYWAPRTCQMVVNQLVLEIPAGVSKRLKSQDPKTRDAAQAIVDRERALRATAHVRAHGARIAPRIVIPVAASTLGSTELAMPLAHVLRSNLEFMRSCAIIEVVPDGDDPGALVELARSKPFRALHRLGFEMILRMDMAAPQFPTGLLPFLKGISATMPETRVEAELRGFLTRLRALSLHSGLDTYVDGANNVTRVRLAIEAGIAQISGSAIHQLVDTPRAGQGASPLAFGVRRSALAIGLGREQAASPRGAPRG